MMIVMSKRYIFKYYEPTAEEVNRTNLRNETFVNLRRAFKIKYELLEKDEERVKAFGERHRDMVLIGDIEGSDDRRTQAITEWKDLIQPFGEPVYPKYILIGTEDIPGSPEDYYEYTIR